MPIMEIVAPIAEAILPPENIKVFTMKVAVAALQKLFMAW